MSNFWTYVRAEFTVEVISKILFSGKFPRFVAITLVFLYLGFAIIRGVFRLFGALWNLGYDTKNRRTRKTLQSIKKHAKKFGDSSQIDTSRSGYLGLILSNPGYQRGIQQITIWINTSTEQLEVIVSNGASATLLSYAQIASYCSGEMHLHRLYALSIFSHLRLNLL